MDWMVDHVYIRVCIDHRHSDHTCTCYISEHESVVVSGRTDRIHRREQRTRRLVHIVVHTVPTR